MKAPSPSAQPQDRRARVEYGVDLGEDGRVALNNLTGNRLVAWTGGIGHDEALLTGFLGRPWDRIVVVVVHNRDVRTFLFHLKDAVTDYSSRHEDVAFEAEEACDE
jgi:hypothetical protein